MLRFHILRSLPHVWVSLRLARRGFSRRHNLLCPANGVGGHRPSLLVDMMPGPFDCSGPNFWFAGPRRRNTRKSCRALCSTSSCLSVTCSVMCHLRNTGSFGCCRSQSCWFDSRFTFLRQFMALLDEISQIFCVKVDSERPLFLNG